MGSKSSYLLAVLLIANPFMLLFFQNCSPSSNPQERNIASSNGLATHESPEIEISFKVEKNLIIK